MAYRDGPRDVILRTRCGAERSMTVHGPMRIVEVPMHDPMPDLPLSEEMDLSKLPAMEVYTRRFEFRGKRDQYDRWIYEEMAEHETVDPNDKRIPGVSYGGKVHEPTSRVTAGALAMAETHAGTMKVLAEACLPYGFEIVNVETQRDVCRDSMRVRIEASVDGKTWVAAKCNGIVSGYTGARDQIERMKREKERLRMERKELREKNKELADNLGVLSRQLATDEGRDKLARENEDLRRNNGQLEYALAQKSKELTAARSRYDAEVKKLRALTEAAFGEREIYLDVDGRVYDRSNRPTSHGSVRFIGSAEIGSTDPDRFAFDLARAAEIAGERAGERVSERARSAAEKPSDGRSEVWLESRFEVSSEGLRPGEEPSEAGEPVSLLASVPERRGPVRRLEGLRVRQVVVDSE